MSIFAIVTVLANTLQAELHCLVTKGVVRMRHPLFVELPTQSSFSLPPGAVTWCLCSSLWFAFGPKFRAQEKKVVGNHQNASQKVCQVAVFGGFYFTSE